MSELFVEQQFRARVDKALVRAKNVLDVNKKPEYADSVPHSYPDKYLLAESVVNVGIAAEINILELLGGDAKRLTELIEWSKTRSVTLRFKTEHKCEFVREEKREQESATQNVTQLVGVFKRVDKTVTTITEYFWNFSVSYELFVFEGNDPNGPKRVVLQSRTGKFEVKTLANVTPRPSFTAYDAIDLNLTWLLQNIQPDGFAARFSINRGDEKCRTPRRNVQVKDALRFFEEASTFGSRLKNYFVGDLFQVQKSDKTDKVDLAALNSDLLFVPVLPLFEKKAPEEASEKKALQDESSNNNNNNNNNNNQLAKEHSSPLLSSQDIGLLLLEQRRALGEKQAALEKGFPDDGQLITFKDAKLVVLALHVVDLSAHVFDGVNYVEDLLRKQLVAAIGKEVMPADFANYMQFHNRKLFRGAYQPRPFSYPIRRPQHYPEGILSLEATLAGPDALPQPIYTVVARRDDRKGCKFAIHAAANVAFRGEVYLHSWLQHSFGGESGVTLSLNARARQFSCFLVLIGRMNGPGLFDPKYGMIVKNKDDIKIPLELETIPSAKAFKEAISALSAEQQAFANAYRSMQLASTLFAVCVIQIKPQLEKLLKLRNDSLTKEIELTQDLLEMFIRYQIPSDLLSFQGNPNAAGDLRVMEVKQHLHNMQEMISDSQKEVVQAAKEKAMFNHPLPPVASVVVRKPLKVLEKTKKSMVRRKEKKYEEKEERKEKRMEKESGGLEMLLDEVADAPAPEAPALEEEAPKKLAEEKKDDEKKEPGLPEEAEEGARDVTAVPRILEETLERQDADGAVRPTIINVGAAWSKRSQASLLEDPTTSSLQANEQKLEKQKCYDLLDALTKCGGLSIDDASLHIVVALTHTFDKSVVDTLVKDNVNPIEKVEKSQLIVASIVHDVAPAELVKPSELQRVKTYSPVLFEK